MFARISSAGFLCAAVLGLAATLRSQSVPTAPDPLRSAANEIKRQEYVAAQQHLELLLAKDPTSAQGYNLLGICESSLGDYARARASFEKSIHLDSQLLPARINLGELLLQLHDQPGALRQFEAALALDPDSLTQDPTSYNGFNLLGLCRMDEHQYESARRAFAHSVRINPHYALARVNLGLALVALNRDSEALQSFLAALEIYPQDPLANSHVGLIYARQGNFTEAAKYLQKGHRLVPTDPAITSALAGVDIATGRGVEAEQLVAQLVQSGRLTSSMRASLAATWLQTDEVDRAVELVKGDPEMASRFYRLGYEKAEALFEKNRSREAAHFLEAIRDLQTPDAAYYGLLGSAYYSLDKPNEASDNLQKAIRLDPSDPDYYFKLGTVFLKYDTPKPAIYIFQTALQSQPKEAKLWFGLGMSYYFASDIAEGERSLRKAIELAPHDLAAYIVLGDLLQQSGRLRESAVTFHEAMHLQPDSFVPYYYFGIVTSHLGKDKLDTAISALGKAVLLNPNFAEGHYELGKALAEKGRTEEAIQELNMSLELKPTLARPHYQLGMIYEKLGEGARARKEFQLFAAASQNEYSHDEIRQLVVDIGKPQS